MSVREGPATPNRFSGGALAIALAVALLACALGAAVAWREPASPKAHRLSSTTTRVRAMPAVAPTPYGSGVTGVIAAIDQQLGVIRLLVGGESYVYHLDMNTMFPDRCLTRAGLRVGQAVRLTLPWYLNGNVTAEALASLHGCGRQIVSGEAGAQTSDSPPAGTGATR
jgi:hypothetical protein